MLISCHFQILLAISEIKLTLPYVLYVLYVKSAVSLKWQVGFENDENNTYFHHHFYLKDANLTVHYITGTHFFSRWPELSIQDIVWYVLKL